MRHDDEPQDSYGLDVVIIKGAVRCVYVNNQRIVGSKPYVSETPQSSKEFRFTLEDLQRAFPDLEIKEKVKE